MNNKFHKKISNKIFDIEGIIHKPVDEYIKENYQENIYMAWRGYLNESDALKLSTCQYSKDARSIYEFAKDLIISWVEEDVIFEILKKVYGIMPNYSGVDFQRQFLEKQNIKTKSDFKAFYRGKAIFIEAVSDHTRYIEKKGKIDLRDNKLQNMIKSEDENYLCMLDWKNKKVSLIKIDENTIFTIEFNHNYNKMVSTMNVNYNNVFEDIFKEDESIKNQLNVFYNYDEEF